ncbi:hypothetical protein Ddye_001428 [Dipteronia dyeriana]|uniref:Reverse transcriptase zinc-binding domain-containing protein n=1 Tax=Dipteronia dyeriana TaxID=168575 RepID=A0AAD9XNK9_9ROSI|nr:hypothetical protein Ddye_001428 [Dipteronia dyeriana]
MNWWNVYSCPNLFVNAWLNGWMGLCPDGKWKRVWNTLFFTVLWTIWEARNKMIFDNKEANLLQSIDYVKFRVVWWFKNLGNGSSESVMVLLEDIQNRCVGSVVKRDINHEC